MRGCGGIDSALPLIELGADLAAQLLERGGRRFACLAAGAGEFLAGVRLEPGAGALEVIAETLAVPLELCGELLAGAVEPLARQLRGRLAGSGDGSGLDLGGPGLERLTCQSRCLLEVGAEPTELRLQFRADAAEAGLDLATPLADPPLEVRSERSHAALALGRGRGLIGRNTLQRRGQLRSALVEPGLSRRKPRLGHRLDALAGAARLLGRLFAELGQRRLHVALELAPSLGDMLCHALRRLGIELGPHALEAFGSLGGQSALGFGDRPRRNLLGRCGGLCARLLAGLGGGLGELGVRGLQGFGDFGLLRLPAGCRIALDLFPEARKSCLEQSQQLFADAAARLAHPRLSLLDRHGGLAASTLRQLLTGAGGQLLAGRSSTSPPPRRWRRRPARRAARWPPSAPR